MMSFGGGKRAALEGRNSEASLLVTSVGKITPLLLDYGVARRERSKLVKRPVANVLEDGS